MQMQDFDHVNILTANLDEMVRWYEDVLGLKSGWRPDFGFPGAWIYLGERAIIHLVGAERDRKVVEPQIEHFAIRATGLDEFVDHLDAKGVEARLAQVPGTDITQVNIFDPDGNHIHIDFRETLDG